MKNDFKNVVITFGLIALVFMYGNFAYQKKVQTEYLDSVLQAHQQEINRLEQNRIAKEANLKRQLQIQAQQRVIAVAPQVSIAPPQPVVVQPTQPTPVQAPVVVQQPAVAPQPRVVPKPTVAVVPRPSRQSRAS